jgi:hypothetical protein
VSEILVGALRRRQGMTTLDSVSVLMSSAAALLGSAAKAGRTARDGTWKDIATSTLIAQIGHLQASLLALLARCAVCWLGLLRSDSHTSCVPFARPESSGGPTLCAKNIKAAGAPRSVPKI